MTQILIISVLFTAVSLVSLDAQSVVIGRIDTEIIGNTSRLMLLTELRIKEGKEFNSLEDLEKVLVTRAQVLRRRRLFKLFEWRVEPQNPDEVHVFIRIVDSFTIYPRPLIQYSTDRGLKLGGRLQYNNAFGSLFDWNLEAYWSPGETRMQFDVEHIPVGPVDLNLSWEQFNGITRFGDPSGNTDVEYESMHSYLALAADLPIGPRSFWSYRFEPHMIWRYGEVFYFNTGPYPDSRYIHLGYGIGLRHGFHYDRVNWKKNFRSGIQIDLENDNTWYVQNDRGSIIWESDLAGYHPAASWLELSGRIGGFAASRGLRPNAGDRLRGVVDFMTFGKWGAFFTAQTSFRIFHIKNIGELQIRPFGDFGYVYSDEWGHGASSWEYCAGATGILYISSLPGLILNVEWGWDFKRGAPELIIDSRLQI